MDRGLDFVRFFRTSWACAPGGGAPPFQLAGPWGENESPERRTSGSARHRALAFHGPALSARARYLVTESRPGRFSRMRIEKSAASFAALAAGLMRARFLSSVKGSPSEVMAWHS